MPFTQVVEPLVVVARLAKEVLQRHHDLLGQPYKGGERPRLSLYCQFLDSVHTLLYVLTHQYTTDFLLPGFTQGSCQFSLDGGREDDLHACLPASFAFCACSIRCARKSVASTSSAASTSCLAATSRRWSVAMGIVEKGAS